MLVIGIVVASVVVDLALLTFLVIPVVLFLGFRAINPNEAYVLNLCGSYTGTIRENGCHWINPFAWKRQVSLKVNNFTTNVIKVNDKIGNPIEIAAVVVWMVKDTYAACYKVDNYTEFVES